MTKSVNTKSKDAREIALHCLIDIVIKGRSMSELNAQLNHYEQSALIKEMVFGVCRWFYYFESIASRHLKKPMRKKDSDVMVLIFLGMYQIQFMKTSDHAAVNETVKLVFSIRKKWAKGLVNVLLRNFLKQNIAQELDHQASFPLWMQKKISTDWSQYSVSIFQSSNEKASVCLRVNPKKVTIAEFCKKLESSNISFTTDSTLPQYIRLTKAQAITDLPGFDKGDFYVQDGSAQMSSHLLNVGDDMTILDACAAPGGKSTHIAELAENCNITALEIDNKRIDRLKENIKRMGQTIQVVCGDAAKPKDWFTGDLYDRILLDAPCSASGIIRRHADIKVLRRESDINELVALQASIIRALWPLLKQGGELLYCTCSIFKQENEYQVERFVNETKDCEEIKIEEIPWAQSRPRGIQVLPGKHGKDGFYYAKLKKSVRLND